MTDEEDNQEKEFDELRIEDNTSINMGTLKQKVTVNGDKSDKQHLNK